MQQQTLGFLLVTAATLGLVHTLMGPDHYVPFIAMSRVGKWSFSKTIVITLVCGLGHVAGSIILGAIGIAAGLAVGGIEGLEDGRGSIAGWLLLGFGLAYMAWGIRQAIRNRPHTHWHSHGDGMLHEHEHVHTSDHAHVHAEENKARRMTPWVLFTIFVFGPCEPLIPLLMYPAAELSVSGIVLVTSVFAVVTLITMTMVVALAHAGLARLSAPWLARYAHATAGFTIATCGAAIKFGL